MLLKAIIALFDDLSVLNSMINITGSEELRYVITPSPLPLLTLKDLKKFLSFIKNIILENTKFRYLYTLVRWWHVSKNNKNLKVFLMFWFQIQNKNEEGI